MMGLSTMKEPLFEMQTAVIHILDLERSVIAVGSAQQFLLFDDCRYSLVNFGVRSRDEV
jgi:hypothetical protein